MQIILSAMAPTISSQLRKQKLPFDKDTVRHFQFDCNSISRLYIRGIIADSVHISAKEKLMKKIISHLKTQRGKK